MNINSIFKTADQGKRFAFKESSGNYRDFSLPNLAFAALLRHWVSNPDDFELVLEADEISGNATAGDHLGWAYYSIVGLRHGENYLCIPLPLLAGDYAAMVLECATRVERGEHKRIYEGISSYGDSILWEGLLAELTEEQVNEAEHALSVPVNLPDDWKGLCKSTPIAEEVGAD